MPILTISRQMGSLGDEVAEALSRKLGWDLIYRSQLITRFFANTTDPREQHLLNESARFFLTESRAGGTYLDHLERSLFELAGKQSAVLVGYGLRGRGGGWDGSTAAQGTLAQGRPRRVSIPEGTGHAASSSSPEA